MNLVPGRTRVLRYIVLTCAVIWPAAEAGGDETLDYEGYALKSGQIVVSDALSPYSLLFSLIPESFSGFLHSGILVLEDNKPFVYEAIGKYPVWRTEVPTATIKGRIARTPLNVFVRRQGHVEIYDPPSPTERNRIARFVHESYENAVPFDAFFSLGDESYYCTEFVARALAATGAKILPVTPIRQNPSVNVVLGWLNITDRQIVTTSLLISPDRFVGFLTRYPSRSAIHAYMAAKREIHRRFTSDQKLGNIFSLEGSRLRFRPQVEDFLRQAMSYFLVEETPLPSEKINAVVSSLARDTFGPFKKTD